MKKYAEFIKSHKIQTIILAILLGLSVIGFVYTRDASVMPQATVYFLNDVSKPASNDRILVFSPHPDDETIGAGGYIAEAEAVHAQVEIVLVTDGNKRHLESKRYEEFKKATGILGVPESNLQFWGYPDGDLKNQNGAEIRSKISNAIASFKPTVVVYPHLQDLHEDHATTGKLVNETLNEGNSTMIRYQYLVHYYRYPQPKKLDPEQFLTPPVNLVSFSKEWKRLMLTTEALDAKDEAIMSYRTQLRVPFLRSLMLSTVRQNELFAITGDK